MRRWIVCLLAVMLTGLPLPATAGPFEDGKAAYARGDYAEAHRLWQVAGDAGDDRGWNNIGVLHGTGRGLPQNDEEAVRFYRRAAERGNMASQINLGGMYERGRGVARDSVEAVRWYRLASDQGFAAGQFNLAVAYTFGRGVVQDDGEALRLLRLAAAQGLHQAQYNLGLFLKHGRGTPADSVEAFSWFLRAAEGGLARAQREAAQALFDGDGVARDRVQALIWHTRAAARDDPWSQGALGYMYAEGVGGLPQNNADAYFWYALAARHIEGRDPRWHADFLEMLDTLKRRMTVAEFAKAEGWLAARRTVPEEPMPLGVE